MKPIPVNTWVRIHGIVLEPHERAAVVPHDTASVPLEIWQKGYLLSTATLGDEVEVLTRTGRRVRGRLIEACPAFELGYGDCRPELLQIGDQLRRLLSTEVEHDQ